MGKHTLKCLGCGFKSAETEKNFFRLPKSSERRNMWLQKLNRFDLINTKISNDYRVCKNHFPDDHLAKSKKVLKRTAFPIINKSKSVSNLTILKKITYPAQSSLEEKAKQTTQTNCPTSLDSSMSTYSTISTTNVKNIEYIRDVDSIMNKYCELLEHHIKSEAGLNLSDTEKQRKKMQRYNNISKMKLNDQNALQILVFLQNCFFNISSHESESDTKQPDIEDQLINSKFTTSPFTRDPLSFPASSSTSSSSTSAGIELLNSVLNDSKKCFKGIRFGNPLEMQDSQKNLTQPQKQKKIVQNSKKINKRLAETSTESIQPPSKKLKSSKELLQSNSFNLHTQVNFGAVDQKEPEEILPDNNIDIIEPEVKIEFSAEIEEILPDITVNIIEPEFKIEISEEIILPDITRNIIELEEIKVEESDEIILI